MNFFWFTLAIVGWVVIISAAVSAAALVVAVIRCKDSNSISDSPEDVNADD